MFMSDGKIGAIDVAAGILIILLGYATYKEYLNAKDEQRRMEIIRRAFKEFDCEKYLNKNNKIHLGLMNTMNELRTMLLDSLDFKEKDLIIKYPISIGMLMRSSIEQAIVVYTTEHGEEKRRENYQNERIMMQILKEKTDEHSIELLKKMKFLRKEKIREKLNGIVHEPHNIEEIKQKIINFSIETCILKFIKDTATLSNHTKSA